MMLQLNLNKLKTRGTMTEYSRKTLNDHNKKTDEIIADTLLQENLSVPRVRRTINALAVELYRPPWK